MSSTEQHDETSKRAVFKLAWPIGVSMISYALKGFVDTLMVGQIGLEALAGVGFAGVIAWTITSFPFGALRGQRPLVSQHLGADERDDARALGVHAFYLAALITALLLALAGVFAGVTEALSSSGGMSPKATHLAGEYLKLRLMWSGPMLLALAIAEYQRSLEQTRIPMMADLIAHPLNILFNYMLIFGHWGAPELGVMGAAIGTGLADCCSLIALIAFSWPQGAQRRIWLSGAPLKFTFAKLRQIWSVGYTGGLQFSLESISFVMITYFISHLGDHSIAVQQAAIQLIHLSILPAVALADGGSVLVGRFVGARQWELARRTVQSTLELVIPFMCIMALIFVTWGGAMISLFLNDSDPVVNQEALRLGERVVWALAMWQIGDAFQVTYRQCLRATGDHKWVMWVGVSMSWLLSVPVIAVTIFYLEGDLSDAWLAHGIEIYIGAWLFHRRWRSGMWKTKRLILSGD